VTSGATIQFKKPHHGGDLSFDEDGERVLAVQPVYPADEPDAAQPTPADSTQDALEAVQHGLLIVIRGGHRDAALVRAGALARLCDLFETDSDAAAAVQVHRSTMMRGVRRIKRDIQRAARNRQKCQAKQ
jgi:hypothetical protein